MTNEDLAIQIQLGHTELYGELWDKCRKLILMLMRHKTNNIHLPNFIDPEDMEQEMYFALCKAVQAYDDTKPYCFNSYLNYSVMRTLRACLPDMRIIESSYNQAVQGMDGEESEFIDFIADETAPFGYEPIELTDLQRKVRQALAELPNRERQAVELFYLKGLTIQEIAETESESVETIRARKNKGIYLLRRCKAISQLRRELYDHYNRRESISYYWI